MMNLRSDFSNETKIYTNMLSADVYLNDKNDNEKNMLLYTLRWIIDGLSNYSSINEIPDERQSDYASYSDKDWIAYMKAIRQSIANTQWVNITSFTDKMVINLNTRSEKIDLNRLIDLLRAVADKESNATYIQNVLISILEKEGPECDAINNFIKVSCQRSNNHKESMKDNMSMLFTSRIATDRAPKYVLLTLAKKNNQLIIHEVTYVLVVEKWQDKAQKVIRKYKDDIEQVMTINT